MIISFLLFKMSRDILVVILIKVPVLEVGDVVDGDHVVMVCCCKEALVIGDAEGRERNEVLRIDITADNGKNFVRVHLDCSDKAVLACSDNQVFIKLDHGINGAGMPENSVITVSKVVPFKQIDNSFL